MTFLDIILWFLFGAMIVYHIYSRHCTRSGKLLNKLPGPLAAPFFGNIPQFRKANKGILNTFNNFSIKIQKL